MDARAAKVLAQAGSDSEVTFGPISDGGAPNGSPWSTAVRINGELLDVLFVEHDDQIMTIQLGEYGNADLQLMTRMVLSRPAVCELVKQMLMALMRPVDETPLKEPMPAPETWRLAVDRSLMKPTQKQK